MSTFVDYSRVARNYDYYRRPDGAEVEVAMMQLYCNKPLKDLHILDAGCGTGNYAKKFLKYGVGKVTLLDASVQMLEKAKAKLEPELNAGTNVLIIPGKLPQIPLQNGTIDVVVFNAVLHHLVSNPDGTNFSEIERAVKESHNVLQPGGLLCILTRMPTTFTRGFWFGNIHKSIGERAAKRYPSIPQFDDIFSKTKFQRLNLMHCDSVEMENTYRNPEGPLDKDWRDFTVFYDEATEEELQYVQNEVRRMKDAGTLEAYMNEHDETYITGYQTLIFARAL